MKMGNVGTMNSSRTKCLLLIHYRSIFVPLLFATNWINCKCCIVSQTYSPGTWFSVQTGRKVCMTSGSAAQVYCTTFCPLNQIKRKFVMYFFVTHSLFDGSNRGLCRRWYLEASHNVNNAISRCTPHGQWPRHKYVRRTRGLHKTGRTGISILTLVSDSSLHWWSKFTHPPHLSSLSFHCSRGGALQAIFLRPILWLQRARRQGLEGGL